MTPSDKWKNLGWKHPVWKLVRYFCSLARRKKEQAAWLTGLELTNQMKVGSSAILPIDPEHVKLFFAYLKDREVNEAGVYSMLRTEDQAVKACTDRQFKVEFTKTKNKDHHQSPKAVVSLVNGIVEQVCRSRGVTYDSNPQSRCVWCTERRLHVTARNMDGAIPGLANPVVVWEHKEYWGGTEGGSKMSDAVYECQLVGRELREFEEVTGVNVVHIVFVDGLAQWTARRSDLKRFVDLTNQGFIDHLLVGTEIEIAFQTILSDILVSQK